MITETRDRKTGITRHEMETINQERACKGIEASGFVEHRYEGNRVVRYIVDFNGVPIEVRTSPARVILYSPNRLALVEFEKLINMDDWMYDNSNKFDYEAKK